MSADVGCVMSLLSKSGILSSSQLLNLQKRVDSDQTLKTVETFTRELVRLGHLTEFQALELCNGRGDHLMLGDYLLIDEIGHGSMGHVFRARHAMMNREVAIKLMQPDSLDSFEQVQRFRREVEAAARLVHPNVVSAFDAGEFSGHYYLVMEYVRGVDLRRRVSQSGPMPVGLALNCLLQAALGLEYAHSRGIVHRDVKPSNLLQSENGNIKVLDLGLSLYSKDKNEGFAGVMLETDLTEAGQVMGTVDYMSPEQALHAHSVDARCDIYSLGCSLHYLLTGQPPYHGESGMSRLVAHRENPIPQLRSAFGSVTPLLDQTFQRMMAKRPEDRFQSMTEVIQQLRLCIAELETGGATAETVQFKVDTGSSSRSSFAGWFITGVLGLLIVAGTVWLRNLNQSKLDDATNVAASNGSTKAIDTAAANPRDDGVKEPIINAPEMDISRPFNPLDRIKFEDNIITGRGWKRDGETLQMAPGPCVFQIPGAIPREYEFRFIAERKQEEGPMIIGLRIGDHQCYVLLDAPRSNGEHVTALGTGSDGRLVAVRKGIVIEPNVPTPVICRVNDSGIDVIVGTETAIEWRGRPSELKLGGGWRVPDKQALFLGANDAAVFVLSDIRVSPLSPASNE